MHQILFLAQFLALVAATDCDPESGNCDDPTSMKVSMLQKKQINEHTVQGETVSSLEERKAKVIAELGSLDSQIAALEDEEDEEDELHEEENHKVTEGTQWCSPEMIGRRREDPSTNGGRCSCRRRASGISSTGQYGCNGDSMEYYGGHDADSRRRGSQAPCNVANCATCHSGYPDSCKNCQAGYQFVADGNLWKCETCSSLTCSSFTTEFGCTSETCSGLSCTWTGTACQDSTCQNTAQCWDQSCVEGIFARRRRQASAACRRRDGKSSTGKYVCCGNEMKYYT